MEEMKFYTEEEALDKVIGEKGTPVRNKYEDDINNFLIGEAIKQTREARNLTQEQLSRTLMPVGDYTKDEIRRMAEEAGLPVGHRMVPRAL